MIILPLLKLLRMNFDEAKTKVEQYKVLINEILTDNTVDETGADTGETVEFKVENVIAVPFENGQISRLYMESLTNEPEGSAEAKFSNSNLFEVFLQVRFLKDNSEQTIPANLKYLE
jgi:hypothetical protein